MREYPFIEKRSTPRFTIALPVTYYHPAYAGQFSSETHDISSQGLGLITRQRLSVGERLDFYLHMSDNTEEIHRKGVVVWVDKIIQDKYRIGVELEGESIRPVEIVLRTLSARNNY